MQFRIADKPLAVGKRGVRLFLTAKQADRRRHIIQRVAAGDKLEPVTARIMRPPPALPEKGLYELAESCEFKVGELIELPPTVSPEAMFGRGALRNGGVSPEDEEAQEFMTAPPASPKVPKPAHGGPPPAVAKAAAAAKVTAGPAPAPKPELAPAPDAGAGSANPSLVASGGEPAAGGPGKKSGRR